MNNLLNKIIPIAFATILTGTYSNTAQAQTENELLQQIEQYSQSDYAPPTLTDRQNNIEQVTNVNQLKDVSPTDWSYEAIRSLSDRYSDARSRINRTSPLRRSASAQIVVFDDWESFAFRATRGRIVVFLAFPTALIAETNPLPDTNLRRD